MPCAVHPQAQHAGNSRWSTSPSWPGKVAVLLHMTSPGCIYIGRPGGNRSPFILMRPCHHNNAASSAGLDIVQALQYQVRLHTQHMCQSSWSTCKSAHRVPNLQLDLLAVDVYHPSAELNANGQVVHWLKALVSELEQQTRLAHACTHRALC
jgi:hypothetical protein